MHLLHLIQNLAKPGYLPVIANKIKYRLMGNGRLRQESLQWYAERTKTLEQVSSQLDPTILAEALEQDRAQNVRANAILTSLSVKLGGGGFIALLFYLIRKTRPQVVVETGVAAGFSSQSILTALHTNGTGTLYSSDFPYFRLKNPEQYIGILVDPAFRNNWHLYTQGDDQNLPRIVHDLQGRKVDLFHYDSDKSVPGRQRAIELIRPHLSDDCLLVFDDVNDNEHFQQWVVSEQLAFRLFRWNRKLIGVACQNAAFLNGLLPE